MTKKIIIGALLGLGLTATVGFSNQAKLSTGVKTLCAGFLPKNNMRIPVGTLSVGGISEDQFNQVMDRIESMYKDDMTTMGSTLHINRLWDDATVNASAEMDGTVRILNMYGGLARHPATTVEGMALVACHELGHHMGGAPRTADMMGSSDWASNEGGADYFAALKCLRRFFAEDNNAVILEKLDIDADAKAACAKQYTNPQDQLICLRESLAGQSVAGLFQSLTGEATASRFGTPDSSQVDQTNDDHPATQCRLDTYFAGMLCVNNPHEAMSGDDYRVASCYTPRDAVGFRPRCWFAPN